MLFIVHHFNYRFWFNFSVENVHVDQRIIFNIVNLSKTRNLFTIGATPIVRSSSRPKWWDNIIDWQCRDIAPWPGRGYRPPTFTTTSPRPTPTITSYHSLSPSTLMMNDTSLHSVGENISIFIINHLNQVIHTPTPGKGGGCDGCRTWYDVLCRCQAYLEQLVEKHPDIVTRESLGKTIQVTQLSGQARETVISPLRYLTSRRDSWIWWPSPSRRRRGRWWRGRWRREQYWWCLASSQERVLLPT